MPNRTDRPLEIEEFEDWKDSFTTQQFLKFLREFKQQVIDELAEAVQSGEPVTLEKQHYIHGSFAVIDDILNLEHADLIEETEEGEDENAN